MFKRALHLLFRGKGVRPAGFLKNRKMARLKNKLSIPALKGHLSLVLLVPLVVPS